MSCNFSLLTHTIFYYKLLLLSPQRVFPKVCLNTNPNPSARHLTSWATTKKTSLALSPVKNWSFNHAWSLNKTYLSLTWRSSGFNSLSINNAIALTFDRNIGFACFGSTCALACSSLINFKYSLTKEDAAGFPVSETISQNLPKPCSSNIFMNCWIIHSTVPEAKHLGQLHSKLDLEPKKRQHNLCAIIFLLKSFQT